MGDESSVLATALSGPSNITRVGEVRARESLHEAIRQACADAKIDPRQLKRACIGAAGAGRKETASVIREMAAEVISGDIEVVGDMQIALQAALGEGPGVIVIAGTGSIAYGRDARGKIARAGGWGFAISDEGSAHWIGRTAVAAVLRAADQGLDDRSSSDLSPADQGSQESSPIFREMKEILNLNSLKQLARKANSHPDFAVLFPAVLTAANSGDAVAQSVFAQAARELAQLAVIVLRRLFPERDGAVPMAMVGGVFRHAPMIRELFYNEVRTACPRIVLNSEVVEPVHGALQMARRSAS